MDNIWRNRFREYIACYEALQTLGNNDILVGNDYESVSDNLLSTIIGEMREELE